METIIGTLIVALALGGAGGLAITFILSRASARAEGEAIVESRLARYAGVNRRV